MDSPTIHNTKPNIFTARSFKTVIAFQVLLPKKDHQCHTDNKMIRTFLVLFSPNVTVTAGWLPLMEELLIVRCQSFTFGMDHVFQRYCIPYRFYIIVSEYKRNLFRKFG